MLYHFPQPYPDELFYSIIARYSKRTLETNDKIVIQSLFDKSMGHLGKSVPFGISNILKKLEIFEFPSENEVIRNHTLFYYYTNFISPTIKSEKYKELLFGNIQGERRVLNGITLRYSPKNFRYCPTCMEEDIKKYGETYWRTSFQIPTVFTCQKHNILLKESIVSIYTAGLIPAIRENCIDNSESYKILTQKTLTFLLLLANESNRLAKEEFDFYFESKALTLLHLKLKGLLDRYGVVRKEELLQKLIKFYGLNFFEIINLNPNKTVEKYCDEIEYEFHLLSYLEQLVFIIFLAGNINGFISTISIKDPIYRFIQNPRCKNKHCKRPVRLDLYLRFEENMRRKINTLSYTCTCGMSFRCIFGEMEVLKQSEYSFPTWYKSDDLYKCIQEKIYISNLSIQEVARVYNLHELQVEMILHECLNEEIDEVLIQSFRMKWCSYIKANTNKHYLQLKYENFELFTWLYRNDKIWLMKSIEESYYNEINPDFLRKRDFFIKEYLRSSMHRNVICQYKGYQIIQWLRNPFIREDYLRKELEHLPNSTMYLEKVSHIYDKFKNRRFEASIY